MAYKGKWLNKLWYIQTMNYYLALKRNELLSQKKKKKTHQKPNKQGRKLGCILLSERGQSEKATYYMILEKVKTTETVKTSVLTRGGVVRNE